MSASPLDRLSTIPTDVDDLTPAWLTSLLRAHGHPVTVTSVDAVPVGSGQMAGSYRLTSTFDEQGFDEPGDLPETMIAKLATGDAAQREFARGAFRNEVRFYADLAATVDVPLPRCHASTMSTTGTEFVLLLDDMAPAVQGDQIAGCTPDQVAAVAVAAAGLHGPRWSDPDLLTVAGLPLPTAEDGELMAGILAPVADAFRDRFPLGEPESRTVDWLVETAADWLVAPVDHFALIHGDLRVDNVLFAPDGSVTLIDWQTICTGHPLRDIAFLVSTSLTTPDRREHEQAIVNLYHQALQRHGVTGFSAADCWDAYVENLIQAPLIVVFGAAAARPTERGDAMFTVMLERSAAAIADLRPTSFR